MTKTYVPLREELTVVETLRFLPDAPREVERVKAGLVAKYGNSVRIEKREFTEQEWSWRADASYTVNRTEYLVKCMRPVYSEADSQAMHKESREKAIASFRVKYAGRVFPTGSDSK